MTKILFFTFKLKADKNVRKEKLNINEIVTLESLELEANSLIFNCRNFFLFSFYCAGIRASDALLLKWSNIKAGRLEYIMEKTGRYKSISLIPKAIAMLDHYRSTMLGENTYIFPFITQDVGTQSNERLFNQISTKTALINKYLKFIAQKAGIEKTISTHIARHSFGDIARKQKASIYDISKMFGHSSIKVTEAYLASLDLDSQDETMKNVLDY